MTRLPSLGPRGEGWFAIQVLLLAATGLSGWLGPAWDGGWRLIGSGFGAILLAAGLGLVLLGLRDLRDALTPLPYPRDQAELVQTGVYGLVRHPIYGGLVAGSVGWGLLTASFAAIGLAVVLLGFFELKARREEAWLMARFPDYSGYRARTRRLIPWIGGGRG
jgi:protein-S-isoprenylcysteine O-methyltransferase Ste14